MPEDDQAGDGSSEPTSTSQNEQVAEDEDPNDAASKNDDGQDSTNQDDNSTDKEDSEKEDSDKGDMSTSEADDRNSDGEDAGGGASPDDVSHNANKILQDFERQRAEYNQSLKREVRAREELEDMLLRMEKHFKSEQEARKQAEEVLEQALQTEMMAKKQLEDTIQKHADEAHELEEERESTRMERKALEAMRQEFENELQAARAEVAKAQDALKTAEDRVRSSERIERAKMEAEYQMRLMTLGNELERVREELTIRTQTLGEEMERWRMQAEYTAASIIEAKGEVMERKRELDVTKERMDRLVEKLYMGREQGLVLHGAIGAAQMYTGQAQTRLLASMQNSYYNAIQAGLPWGGTLTQHGHLPALPPAEVQPLGPPSMHPAATTAQRKGAKPMGKGTRQDGKFGKTGKNAGSLPPLGPGGLYGTGNSVPGYAQPLGSQAKGHQGKTKQKPGQQRQKDRFGGQRF